MGSVTGSNFWGESIINDTNAEPLPPSNLHPSPTHSPPTPHSLLSILFVVFAIVDFFAARWFISLKLGGKSSRELRLNLFSTMLQFTPAAEAEFDTGKVMKICEKHAHDAISRSWLTCFSLWEEVFTSFCALVFLTYLAWDMVGLPKVRGVWPAACGLRPVACGLRPAACGLCRPPASHPTSTATRHHATRHHATTSPRDHATTQGPRVLLGACSDAGRYYRVLPHSRPRQRPRRVGERRR